MPTFWQTLDCRLLKYCVSDLHCHPFVLSKFVYWDVNEMWLGFFIKKRTLYIYIYVYIVYQVKDINMVFRLILSFVLLTGIEKNKSVPQTAPQCWEKDHHHIHMNTTTPHEHSPQLEQEQPNRQWSGAGGHRRGEPVFFTWSVSVPATTVPLGRYVEVQSPICSQALEISQQPIEHPL